MTSTISEGNVALIANPASQNGRGYKAAIEAAELLRKELGEDRLELLLTERPYHATELATALDSSVTCVIALGGDGIINEVANGLMQKPYDQRPTLGVIPIGSGNDYAETIHMAYTVPEAVKQILVGKTIHADVGRVNGRYFVETLSFGLDAAIALDTVQRRVKTGHTGTRLYLESAIDQIFHHLVEYQFTAEINSGPRRSKDARKVEGRAYLFAVQLGPTYGGHFRICPHASLTDGLLDLAWATPHMSSWHALTVLLRAKFGKHTGSPHTHFQTAETLTLDFSQELPGQMDGERITGTHFEIECIRDALTVIVGE